ncbi:hypothetical protein TNCT_174421 [Trichonephila clavata]|uniref:Uncharacterized protein n=1 Tax=Trichonephila clavata TaxID=2740835 RepID=A0A8X6L203_TRICU|nr:hypothetical protein TNCT_174421 [Trichonephila clavata]
MNLLHPSITLYNPTIMQEYLKWQRIQHQFHREGLKFATDLKMAYHDNLRTIPLTGLGSESEEDGEIEKEMDTKDGSMATENRDRMNAKVGIGVATHPTE